MMIIFELTSDYQVALGAGISICFANLVSSKIYGHSAFDQLLLNRDIDIQLGRDSLQLQSINIDRMVRKDYIRLSKEHSIEDMIEILSKAKTGEGYIIDPRGILVGKVLLPEILLISNKSSPPKEESYINFLSDFLTNFGRAIEAKLHTDVSFLSEYSTISAQRLDDLITPIFF